MKSWKWCITVLVLIVAAITTIVAFGFRAKVENAVVTGIVIGLQDTAAGTTVILQDADKMYLVGRTQLILGSMYCFDIQTSKSAFTSSYKVTSYRLVENGR